MSNANHKIKSRRFASISDIIDIKKLEKETRKFLYIGFVVAVCFHVGLGLYFSLRKTEKTRTTYIPVELIESIPRTTRPFAMHEKSARRQYLFRKGFIPGKPSGEIATKRLSKLEIPEDEYRLEIDPKVTGNLDMLCDSLLTHEMISNLPKDIIPLKNQVFFDSGQYKTEIVFDPNNKQAIQGYVHFGIGWGKHLTPPDNIRVSVDHLANAVKKYTNIEVISDVKVYLSYILTDDFWEKYFSLPEASRRRFAQEIMGDRAAQIHKYSFIYINTDKSFTFTKNESDNLAEFLRTGGFMIFDNGAVGYDRGNIDKNIRENIYSVLNTPVITIGGVIEYKNCWLKPLTSRHPVFHSFFDFYDGPPPGTEQKSISDRDEIIGVFIGGGGKGPLKLVGVYTPQGYSLAWHDEKNIEQLEMGVNLVIYALTRYKEIASNNEDGSELISGKRIMRK